MCFISPFSLLFMMLFAYYPFWFYSFALVQCIQVVDQKLDFTQQQANDNRQEEDSRVEVGIQGRGEGRWRQLQVGDRRGRIGNHAAAFRNNGRRRCCSVIRSIIRRCGIRRGCPFQWFW
jgi:hypothetical protein